MLLDFYPPVYDEKKKKETISKFLDLFVYEKPTSKAEKDHNKYTMLKVKQTESEYQFDFLSKTLDMKTTTIISYLPIIVYFSESIHSVSFQAVQPKGELCA
ncbi:MAG: hypothetical protein EOO43_07215 [Flavobacterium sp.]|nr:MAG: hypothetical protein EOO43_07215 [Flavobacterium sp.]